MSIGAAMKHPLIHRSRLSSQLFKQSVGGLHVRVYGKGDVICKQGEHDHTAFYIESGSVNIYVSLRAPRTPSPRGPCSGWPNGSAPAAGSARRPPPAGTRG